MCQSLMCWLEAHDKLAGWAQFLGAMLALAAAIGVPAWLNRDARLQSRLRSANALRANAQMVLLTGKAAHEAVARIDESWSGPGIKLPKFDVERVRRLAEACAKVEVHQLPTPIAVSIMVDALAAVERLHTAMKTAINDVDTELVVRDATADEIRELAIELTRCFNSLSDECNVIERGYEKWSPKIQARIDSKRPD